MSKASFRPNQALWWKPAITLFLRVGSMFRLWQCGPQGSPPQKKNVSTTFGEAQPFIFNTHIEVLVNMAHSVSGWNRYCHKDPQKDTWTFRGLPNWSKQTSCYLETAPAGHEEYLQTCRECNKPLWKLLLPSWEPEIGHYPGGLHVRNDDTLSVVSSAHCHTIKHLSQQHLI